MTTRPYPYTINALFKRTGYDPRMEPLVHAAVGVCGEAVELMFSTDGTNMLEELGDLEFYVEAAVQQLEQLAGEGSTVRERFEGQAFELLAGCDSVGVSDIAYYGNEVLDGAKKLWVYRKPFEEMEIKLVTALANVKACMLAMYEELGTSEASIRAMNQAKLGARYPEGVYSDKDAQERKDKLEGV